MFQSQYTSIKAEERIIIRRYTDGLAGDNALERAVQKHPIEPLSPWPEKRNKKETQIWQETDQSARAFDDTKRSRDFLLDEWHAFRMTMPEEKIKKRQWLSKSKNGPSANSKVKDLEVTSLTDLQNTVRGCEDAWKNQDTVLGQKVTARFHKVCQCLESYQISHLLPSENDYLSVLCGSVNLLIQASVRHVEYAEELSQSIDTIIAQLAIAMVSVGIMNTPPMREKLSKLFTQVFTFLREAMRWWGSKTRSKFADAFNGDLQKSLKKRVSEIEKLSKDLRENIENAHIAESRDHRLTTEEVYAIVRDSNNKIRKQELDLAELKELYKRQVQYVKNQQAVAIQMVQALAENVREGKNQYVQRVTLQGAQGLSETRLSSKNIASFGLKPETAEPSSAPTPRFLRTEVLTNAQQLEGYVVGKKILNGGMAFPVVMDHLIVHALQQWSVALTPQLLWIIGPSDYALPSNMSSAAMTIALTALKLNVPIVSHFCALPPYGTPCREETGLIGLIYSLILQILEQMAPEIDSGIDLAVSRFQGLDDSIESWDESLNLLADLLHHFSLPLLLCVIDGLGRLDFEGGSPLCRQLVEVLQGQVAQAESAVRLKVLFTTSGKSSGQRAALPDLIPESQRLYTEYQQGKSGSGRPLLLSNQLSHRTGD